MTNSEKQKKQATNSYKRPTLKGLMNCPAHLKSSVMLCTANWQTQPSVRSRSSAGVVQWKGRCVPTDTVASSSRKIRMCGIACPTRSRFAYGLECRMGLLTPQNWNP